MFAIESFNEICFFRKKIETAASNCNILLRLLMKLSGPKYSRILKTDNIYGMDKVLAWTTTA